MSPGRVLAPQAAPTGGGEGVILAFGAAVVVACEFVIIGMAPAMARDLGLSLAQAGWFVTWFAIGSAALGPVAVMAARRMRADRAMILALAPFAAAMLTPLIDGVWAISLLRLLQGAALSLFISVASDSLRRLWGRDDKAVSRIYVGVIVGTVVAAPAGAQIAELWDWRATFVGIGILSSLAMILIFARSGLRLDAMVAGGLRREASVFLRPKVLLHLSLSLAQFAAMFCTYAYLAGVLEDIGVAKGAIGAWLLLFGLAGIVGNAAAGRLPPVWMRVAVLATVVVLTAAAAILPFLTPAPIVLVPVLIGWGAAHAASFVLCQLRVTRAAPQAPRLAAAMNISAANIGIAAGSAIGGLMLEACGLAGLSAAGFILCALTFVLAASARYRDRDIVDAERVENEAHLGS